MTRTEKKAEQAKYLEYLRETLPPGSLVTVQYQQSSQSGMQRTVKVLTGSMENGTINDITLMTGKACGLRLKEFGGRRVIAINGCGFNVCHDVADTIARTLDYELYQGTNVTAGYWAQANARTRPSFVEKPAGNKVPRLYFQDL